MNRRNFLKGLAASVGLAAAAPLVHVPEAKAVVPEPLVQAYPHALKAADAYCYFWPEEKLLTPSYFEPVYFEGIDRFINTGYQDDEGDDEQRP